MATTESKEDSWYTEDERYMEDSIGTNVLYAVEGSAAEFQGDAAVNAANSGGLDGGGIDAAFNAKGGERSDRSKESAPARRRWKTRIPTGTAKTTTYRGNGNGYGDLKCKSVIHAVGPNFNEAQTDEDTIRMFEQLKETYDSIMHEAKLIPAETLGVCMISASIFSGSQETATMVEFGWHALKQLLTDKKDLGMHVYFIHLATLRLKP